MATNNVIQMFNETAAGGDSVASIDMPDDGNIEHIHLELQGLTMDLEGDAVFMMVSFGSTSQFEVNDARNVIARTGVGVTSATAASLAPNFSHVDVVFPSGIKVFAGERIHLHTVVEGGALVGSAVALLTMAFRKFTARRR